MKATASSTTQLVEPWLPSGVRYPYLLPENTARFSDDMEIDDDELFSSRDGEMNNQESLDDFEMVWVSTSELEGSIRYIALDTNVLIRQLHLVKSLHDLLYSQKSCQLLILVPSVVINELDSLAARFQSEQTSQNTSSVGDQARAATAWLLQVNKARRDAGWGVVRFQRWVEKVHQDLRKGDDRVLDCCLFFLTSEGGSAKTVTLWTEDKNLSLLAETNDIPTVGGRYITLERVLRVSAPDLPSNYWKELPKAVARYARGNSFNGPSSTETGDMEIDEDVTSLGVEAVNINELNQVNMPSTNTSPPLSPPLPTPSDFLPSTTPSTSNIEPNKILQKLSQILIPILERLTTDSHSLRSPEKNLQILSDLHKSLTNLEESMTPPSRYPEDRSMTSTRIQLLRAISSLRTISSYFDFITYNESGVRIGKDQIRTSRRPRIGQVVDSVETLVLVLEVLELLDGEGEDLLSVADDLRRLK